MTSFLKMFDFPDKGGTVGAELEAWTVWSGTDDPRKEGQLWCIPRDFFDEGDTIVVKDRRTKVVLGQIVPELSGQQIELITAPQDTVGDLKRAIKALYNRAYQRTSRYKKLLSSTPMPPHALSRRHLKVYPKERYQEIFRAVVAEYGPEMMMNGWTAGLHLHVAAQNWVKAFKMHNGLIMYIPYLVAISLRDSRRLLANMNLVETLGGDFIPPVIQTKEHFELIAEQKGFIDDPGCCWSLVRINPVGTVEVRAFDVQAEPQHTAELAAVLLVQCHQILNRESATMPANEQVTTELLLQVLNDPYSLRPGVEEWLQGLCVHAKIANMEEEFGYIISLMRRQELNLGPAEKLVA